MFLSHYSKGDWIQAISGNPVILDSNMGYISLLDARFNDSDELFYTRNLRLARELLNKYEVKYIWIDKEMKEGLIWTREEQGLLFLFRNKENFKKVYSNDNVEIWEVTHI